MTSLAQRFSGPAANAGTAAPPRYLILQSWFGELRRLTAGGAR